MSVWQIFLLYFLKFSTLDGSSFYQQLYLLGMDCGNSITSHIISGSTRNVRSRIECAAHCLTTTGCETILFDNKIDYRRDGFCTLVTESSLVSPYVLESNSSVCFMKKISVETTHSTPTETIRTPTTSSMTLTKTTQSTVTPTTTTSTTATTSLTTTTTWTTTSTTLTPTITSPTLATTTLTTTTLTPTTPATMTTTPTTTTTSLPTMTTTTTPATTTTTPTTTTPTTTTPTTTTTSMGETIIDIIDNLNDMCTTNSRHDIAIVTTDGVHLYDDYSSLTNEACRNMTIAELFNGFASLPDISTWKALLSYENIYIDLFTDAGQVYQWYIMNGFLYPDSEYPKSKQAYIADAVYFTPTNIFSGAQWAVYTHLTYGMTLYFFDASTIYFYRNLSPNEGNFSISDTTNMDIYGRPLNLWYNLPRNVVGVTRLGTYSFIVVDVNLNVYSYSLPDHYNVNTSTPVCVLLGQLRL